MSAKLKQLQAVRSRLADDLIAFCDAAITHLDATPYRCRVDGEEVAVTISGTVIDARVYTEHRATEAKPDSSSKRGPQADEESASQNDHERRHAELNGDPVDIAGREAIPWSRALQRAQRGRPLVVLGAPGRGKTTLTRHAAVQRLTAVRDGLAGHTLRPEEGEPMLWTTCTVLAGTPLRGNDPADLMIRAAFAALGLPGDVPAASLRVRQWLRGRLAAGRCAVALDSLDEVPERKRAAFRSRAHRLRHLASPLILTCRSHDWEQLEDVPWPHLVEVKLAPFTRREQSAFVRRFFREEVRPRASAQPQNPDLSGALERELSRNVSLRRMCASPILIFFTCLLHANEPWPQRMLRRTEIYESMCSRLFRGTWRGEAKPPPWADGDRREGEVTTWLAEVALALFRAAPEAKEFSLDAWKNAVLAMDLPCGGKNEAKLFEQLVECGLFVPVGKRHGQPHYVWPHRSFLAYFAGKALARRPREVWLRETIEHLWFQAPWEDVLLFLAGHLDEPDVEILLREIDQQPEDIFYQRLRWQWRFAGESCGVAAAWGAFWGHQAAALALDDIDYWKAVEPHLRSHFWVEEPMEPGTFLRWYTDPASQSLIDAFGPLSRVLPDAHESLSCALESARHRWTREKAAKALSQICYPSSLPALLNAFSKYIEDEEILHYNIANALAAVGSREAVSALLSEFFTTGSSVWKFGAERALSQLQIPEVVETLLSALDPTRMRNGQIRATVAEVLHGAGTRASLPRMLASLDPARERYSNVRRMIALAVGSIGDSTAVPSLLRCLDSTKEPNADVRDAAIAALGAIGCPDALPALSLRVNPRSESKKKAHTHREFRIRVIEAVSAIGGRDAVVILLRSLSDNFEPDGSVRRHAAQALGELGEQSVVSDLVACLETEPQPWVRGDILTALGKIGAPEAIPSILKMLDEQAERDDYVRCAAAEALGAIGDRRTVPVLIEHLKTKREADDNFRAKIIMALARIGDDRAVPILSDLVRENGEYDSIERESLPGALGKFDHHLAFQALLEYFDSGRCSEDGLLETVKALRNFPNSETEKRLIQCSEERADAVRRIVTSVLGEIGGIGSIHVLMSRLKAGKEKDFENRENIGQSLYKLYWRAQDRTLFLV